ncbi:MAG: FAD-binding oxidoreductase [Anaerolineae bacterium]|nr:FAD-binding oxidoreductase [Anaerolineae bacterium]
MLSNSLSTLAPDALKQLQAELDGELFVPGDEGFEAAHRGWNLAFRHTPALVVKAMSASDVADAVRFARENHLGIAVQGTGHGPGRAADGALLINMSDMNHAFVDAESRTAWVEGGAKWKAVLEKSAPLGLAPLLGSSPYVGVTGYTLGGGMGWLARKYGMAIDAVNWFDVVTPEGHLLRASANEHAELFWALRGGGAGNLGVVVAMEINLYPETDVYGGNLLYPGSMAREVLVKFREWVKDHPENLTAAVSIMHYPPMPQVPDFLRGQSFVQIRGLYAGPAVEGQVYIQEWLDWREPVVNMWRPMPFAEIATVSNDPEEPMPGKVSGAWLRELNDEAIDTILRFMFGQDGPPPVMFTEIRHAGGAVARAAKTATAYSSRDAQFLLGMGGLAPTPEIFDLVAGYQAEFKAALGSALAAPYLNFTEGHERREATHHAFSPENLRRLQAVKAQYDAENRFDYGFDVKPAK